MWPRRVGASAHPYEHHAEVHFCFAMLLTAAVVGRILAMQLLSVHVSLQLGYSISAGKRASRRAMDRRGGKAKRQPTSRNYAQKRIRLLICRMQ